MFNKRKRSTRSWAVRAIEAMLVMVAAMLTANVILPQPPVTEIRLIERVTEVQTESAETGQLVQASYMAALDYMYQKNYVQSAGLLSAITDVAEDHYWSHVTYSFVLYEMGQYDEAIDVATRGIEIDPSDPVAWNNRCILNALMENYEQALSDCDESIKANPYYDYSYNNRCYVLMEIGQLYEAELACNQALENNHRMPEWVYTNLGRIALKRGLDNPAMEMFMTALSYNPTHADAYAGLGDVMLIKSNFTKSLEYYDLYARYAGAHYESSYDAKIGYAKDSIAFAGQN